MSSFMRSNLCSSRTISFCASPSVGVAHAELSDLSGPPTGSERRASVEGKEGCSRMEDGGKGRRVAAQAEGIGSSSTSITEAAGNLGGGIGGLSALQRRIKRIEEELLLVLVPEELTLVAEALILPKAERRAGGRQPVLRASSLWGVHGVTSSTTQDSAWRSTKRFAFGSPGSSQLSSRAVPATPLLLPGRRASHRDARRRVPMERRMYAPATQVAATKVAATKAAGGAWKGGNDGVRPALRTPPCLSVQGAEDQAELERNGCGCCSC